MGRFLGNRDGGKTDELGHNFVLKKAFTGNVVSGFTTTQAGTPALSVEVAAGQALIEDGDKKYEVWADSTQTVTISTPNVSNPRKDYIVAYVDTTETPNPASPNNPTIFKFAAVAGTPAGSPSAPSSGQIQSAIGAANPYAIIAEVLVGAGVTTITNANITDRRTMLSSSQPIDSTSIKLRSVELETIRSETEFSHVASGLVWSGDAYGSTRVASMTSGVAYIGGRRFAISAVTSRTFTASKDTYIDIDSSGTLVYTEVSNNAASPALAAGSIRIGIIVTGASNIAASTSISQGGYANILPVISAHTLKGSDTLGNVIYPKGPASTSLMQVPYKFEVRRDAALSTSTGYTAIPFDAKNFDTGNNVDVVTNKGRFTAPVAGYYCFVGAVLSAVTNGDHVYGGLMKNGAEYRRYYELNWSATSNETIGWTAFVRLSAGDYVEFAHAGGAARTILVGSGGIYCYFSGYLQSAS